MMVKLECNILFSAGAIIRWCYQSHETQSHFCF